MKLYLIVLVTYYFVIYLIFLMYFGLFFFNLLRPHGLSELWHKIVALFVGTVIDIPELDLICNFHFPC